MITTGTVVVDDDDDDEVVVENAATTADLELPQSGNDSEEAVVAASDEEGSESSTLPPAPPQVWEMDSSQGLGEATEQKNVVEQTASAGSEESAMRVELATLVKTANELAAQLRAKARERKAKAMECNVLAAKV